ncbi:acyltransferase family protein [Acuticoccus mangrovi]|uniref:Acyltransferase n=1 Tax=Acuticoccus mangrovi TaxID=2796142 RepID=A0A934IGA3_9HYPH|nr:acyltransferase [Acuticoccus mangrovi]MBJ3775923.1 acyltransferase [Acuticoccus mangrovi]
MSAAAPRLASLEAGRGLAALAVALFHAAAATPDADRPAALQAVLMAGQSGVDYFFVLSGFVIAHAHGADIGRPERLRAYLLRRARRIYLPYWVVLAAILPAFVLVPTFGLPAFREPATLLAAVVLAGPADPTPLTVAWTLFHEVLFYALFGLAILHRGVGVAALGLWFAVCALGEGDTYAFAEINLLFGFGMAARVVLPAVKAPAAVALLGATVFLAAALTGGSPIIAGLGAAALLAGLAACEAAGRLAVPAVLVALGGASYALYLTHGPVLSALLKLAARTPVPIAATLGSLPLLVAATLVAGIAFHRHVETPLLARLSRRTVRLRPTTDTPR